MIKIPSATPASAAAAENAPTGQGQTGCRLYGLRPVAMHRQSLATRSSEGAVVADSKALPEVASR
jgi:hypothetical protein